MAVLTKNQNFLQPTGYKISIDRKNYPNLEFFLQSIVHPAVSVAQTEVPYKRTAIHMPGDKILYDEVTFEMLLDEDMKAYKEMYNWLERLVEEDVQSPSNRSGKAPSYADITLSMLSSHSNTTNKFIYRDCIPTNIGSVNLSSATTDVAFLAIPVSFSFSYFDII